MRLDTELLELEIGNEEQRELGPLKYLAETTGKDMGQVVNWFLLLIVFVFDPLAIAMVVAANFAFAQIKSKENNLDIIKEVPDMREPLGEWADKEIVFEEPTPKMYEVYGDIENDFKELKARFRKQSTIPNSEFEKLINKYKNYGKKN